MGPIRMFSMPPWRWTLPMTAMGLNLLLVWVEPSLAEVLLGKPREPPARSSLGPLPELSPAQSPLQDLPDGHYQLCSEPDPQDWRDGAGACFRFSKQADAVEGYYGYPHSSDFICLRGKITQPSWVFAEGQLLIWGDAIADAIPPGRFTWDGEGRLTLDHAGPLRQVGEEGWPVYRVLFRTAELDTERFYRYPAPRMKSHLDLCEWPGSEPMTTPLQTPLEPPSTPPSGG